jgi:pectate lyase
VKFPILPFASILLAHTTQAGTITWKGGDGDWQETARWGGAVPAAFDIANLEGASRITLTHGEATCTQLDLGAYHGSAVTFEMTGGALSLSKLLRIGETPGSSGRFLLRGGELNAFEICVGGANTGRSADRPVPAEFEISGGEVLTRHLALGWTSGAMSVVRICGSKAAPIAVLDYLWIGIRQKDVEPSQITFEYQLDADGVTPIILWNKNASSITLVDEICRSACRLVVSLKAAPPGGEIALLQLPKLCRGIFTDLPEASPVRATFAGHTYEWKITYKGGPAHTDVTLIDPQEIGANGEAKPYTTAVSAKRFTLDLATLEMATRRRIAREEKQEPPVDPNAPLAFPGATGFGAYTPGGRGGKVLFVTTLEDSGPGSLREALTTKGPRTVLFRVGGTIHLKSGLTIREPFLTVAGQTAPGQGIALVADSSTHADTLVINQTHDVILRYLRIFNGKAPGPSHPDDGGDCLSIYDSQNFIIDHCSTHFGTDETLSATGACDRYTVQWSIIAEGLNYERHSMSSLLGGGRSTWHHNLFAHAGSRNPNFAGEVRCDFRSNLIYDWGFTCGQGSFVQLNYSGNYLKPGPSTKPNARIFLGGQATALPGTLYLANNVLEGFPEITRDNWLGTPHDRAASSPVPFPLLSLPSEPPDTARDRVLSHAGANLPTRDGADTRLIREVRESTGQIIDSQDQVGGVPILPTVTSDIIDTDHDGLPDDWERQNHLDPANPHDALTITGGTYTWLEIYLNQRAAPGEN